MDRSNNHGIEQWRCSIINRTNITLVSSHSHTAEPAQCEAAILIDHIRTSAQHNLHESPKEIIHRLLRLIQLQ